MKRTFVYKAPTENRPPPTSASTGDCHRKRKRSPESSDHVASAKKLMEGDLANDEEALPGGDDDYLDKIGTAAIELYELTQRDPQQLSVDSTTAAPPASIPRPEDTAAQVHAGLEQQQQQQQRPARRGTALAVGASAPIAGTTTLPPNRPAYAPSQQQQQTQQQQQQPATTLVIAHSNSRAPLPATAPQPSELLDKIRELQEVNYRKDGETKVLRSEKERLAEELRKKEEAARDVQTRLLSEKEELEQRYAREKEALATTLKFNEQELSSLQEKCRLLEDRLKRSNQPPSSAKPASPAITKVPPLDVKDGVGSFTMDFMSAEANALSSQTTSLLTAGVVVGTKRPSSMLEPSFNSFKAPNQDQHHKKPPVHTPPSSSSYKPHLSSNGGLAHPLEIHAVYQVKQEEGTTVPATPTTTIVATPTTHPVTVTPTLPMLKEDALKVEVAQPDYDWDYKPVALDIPELSGPQLLMLLANPSLNRPAVAMEISSGPQSAHKHTKTKPVQRTWSHMAGLGEEEEHEDTPLHEPWSPEAPQKLTGLLSLLHLKTPSSIFPVNTRALSATVYPGEVKGDHLRPDSLMKKIRQASGTARKGVTEMEPNPVGRFEPDASSSGPAGRGHTHFSSTSTKVLFDPAVEVLGPQTRIAAFEEWNPTKSTSLARGVDPNRLEEHISLILSTADTMGTGPSHFNTTPPSFPPSSSSSSSPCHPRPPPDMVGDMAATLLPHLGEVLVRYHGEQFLKTRPPLDATGQLDFSDGEGAGHLNMSVSMSSRSSGEELLPRSEVNYKVLLEAVTALETLVVCNRRVRAAILAPPPPPFKLESRPSSVVDQAPVYALRSGGHGPGDSSPGSAISRECTPVGVKSEGKPSETIPLRAEHANNHIAGVKEASDLYEYSRVHCTYVYTVLMCTLYLCVHCTFSQAEVWKGKRLVCMANHIPSLSTSVWYGHDEVGSPEVLHMSSLVHTPLPLPLPLPPALGACTCL